MTHPLTLAAIAAGALTAAALPAVVDAKTLRWARTAEALTMDPHSQNEGPTTGLLHQMYESLIIRDHTGALEAALATGWAPDPENPNRWIFTLREGVTFHGGETFDAEDVVFSIGRAQQPSSNFKELITSIVDVEVIDSHTVAFVTDGPNPILPNNMTNIFMMDSGWAEANDVTVPQDFAAGEDNFAARNVNGTGPYILVSRAPDERTVMRRNEDYWGREMFALDASEVIYTPIKNPATRVAALLSGEVDFIQDVPVQDLDRVAQAEGLTLGTTPQNRSIFFGMNVGADDLASDNVEGANPFADPRVREAMTIAINREAIQRVVMRGQSVPAGVIMAPFVNGWTEELDAYPAYDIEAAKALMAEAGYADGFSAVLDCPNDRYINDEAICQAAVGMFGQIGIDVRLEARPRAQHFPLIQNQETDFYLLGWGVPTYDSEYIFNFLVHGRTDQYGSWNATRFDDEELNALIQSLASNVDIPARNADIATIWQRVQAERLYLPIHHQVLNWGLSEKVSTLVEPEDSPKIKYFEIAD